jgi:hypothetical protein
MFRSNESKATKLFSRISISLASSDAILTRSYGENLIIFTNLDANLPAFYSVDVK